MHVEFPPTMTAGLQCNCMMAVPGFNTSAGGMNLDQMGHHLLHLYASAVPLHEHPPVHILCVD